MNTRTLTTTAGSVLYAIDSEDVAHALAINLFKPSATPSNRKPGSYLTALGTLPDFRSEAASFTGKNRTSVLTVKESQYLIACILDHNEIVFS